MCHFEQILEAAPHKTSTVKPFPISKPIQIRWRHAWHCWRSKEQPVSDILLRSPTHRCTSIGQLARSYIHQPCADTWCCLEDLSRAMNDRDGWWERESQGTVLLAWWFGLVSLFNGISTFVGYLMPKVFSYKNSRGTI